MGHIPFFLGKQLHCLDCSATNIQLQRYRCAHSHNSRIKISSETQSHESITSAELSRLSAQNTQHIIPPTPTPPTLAKGTKKGDIHQPQCAQPPHFFNPPSSSSSSKKKQLAISFKNHHSISDTSIADNFSIGTSLSNSVQSSFHRKLEGLDSLVFNPEQSHNSSAHTVAMSPVLSFADKLDSLDSLAFAPSTANVAHPSIAPPSCYTQSSHFSTPPS